MIELQKRYTPYERRLPVMVIDLLNDPDSDKVVSYLIDVFSKDRYLWMCKQAANDNTYWAVVDKEHADY